MKSQLLIFSRFILLVTSALLVFSCNKAGENEYIITGTIKGVDGKKVYLEVQDDMTGAFKTLDTVVVEGGKFTIKGSAKESDINLIQIESVEGKIPFILENGDIEMDINKDSLSHSEKDDEVPKGQHGKNEPCATKERYRYHQCVEQRVL
jgi:hypothetical protein